MMTDEPNGTTGDEQLRDALEEQSKLVKLSNNDFVQFILATAPYTGGVGSLLSKHAQRRQELRLRRLLTNVALEVAENRQGLADKIDYDYVHTEEFAATIIGVLEEASRTADERKLAALASFMIAASRQFRPDINWQDIFLRYMSQLSGVHVAVVNVFYGVQGWLPRSDRLGGSDITNKVPLDIRDVMGKLQTTDRTLVMLACTDLAKIGLLADWRDIRSGELTYQQRYTLTDNGVLLSRFLARQWPNNPGEPVML